MNKKAFQILSSLIIGCAMLSMMSFACRETSNANPELKAEIEAVEAEVDDLDQAEKEIEEASAKVDSLLNEIN